MRYLLVNKTEFNIEFFLIYGLNSDKLEKHINSIYKNYSQFKKIPSINDIINYNIIYNVDLEEDITDINDDNLLYVFNEDINITFDINKYKKTDLLIILVQTKDEESRIQKSLNENHVLAIIININTYISNLNLSFIIFFINSFLKINKYQLIKWYKLIDKF